MGGDAAAPNGRPYVERLGKSLMDLKKGDSGWAFAHFLLACIKEICLRTEKMVQ